MKATLRAAAHWSLPLVLTGLSLGWTVYAVGELLSRQAPAPLALTVAVVYDAVWLYALAMETAHRRQGSKGTLPAVLGWVFLVTSVVVLFSHGLMYATAGVAVIGAVVPVAAKATLIMAVERDTTRISPEAQQQIDAIRSATRDQVAIGRAVTRAKVDRQTTAALLEREERKASGQAQKVRHQAAELLTQVTSEHPVPDSTQSDAPQSVPELFSGQDLARVLDRPALAIEPADQPASQQASKLASQQAVRSMADQAEQAPPAAIESAPAPASVKVAATESARPRRATGRVPDAAKSDRPARTDAELLDAARELFGPTEEPIAERIRTELRVGADRARRLRDDLKAERRRGVDPPADPYDGFEVQPVTGLPDLAEFERDVQEAAR